MDFLFKGVIHGVNLVVDGVRVVKGFLAPRLNKRKRRFNRAGAFRGRKGLKGQRHKGVRMGGVGRFVRLSTFYPRPA